MKITSTWLLTSAAQVVITIAVGAFMLVNAAVICFYVIEGYGNYQKKESADVILTGRIHKFSSLDFTTNPTGTMRTCVGVTANNGWIKVHELGDSGGSLPVGNFCGKLFRASNLTNWKDMAPTSNGTGVIQKVLWSITFFVIFMSGAYLVASIPANLVVIALPGLTSISKVIVLAFTLPVVLFWAVFVTSAWQYHPSYWKSPDGYVVETEKVFITRDKRVFSAPETLFGWTSSKTMQERKVL